MSRYDKFDKITLILYDPIRKRSIMREALIQFNSWDFILSMVTFLVLFLILKHFFFEKVHDFMMKRETEVRREIERVETVSREADEKLAAYEKRIGDVEHEGREIIMQARNEARNQAKTIISDAKAQAQARIDQAELDIEREEENARESLRRQVGELAVLAAGRIVEKDLTAADHQEIIEQVIKEAEETPWS